MLKITVKADGMMCRMCESHANGAVRKAFEVKKATSTRAKVKACSSFPSYDPNPVK